MKKPAFYENPKLKALTAALGTAFIMSLIFIVSDITIYKAVFFALGGGGLVYLGALRYYRFKHRINRS